MNIKEEQVLERARSTYGDKNQILVCIEELNELACVLAKFPRYEDTDEAIRKLCDSALDEVADVTVILAHVKAIFGFSDDEVNERASKKISRLERWLNTSSSMHQTTVDRAVDNGSSKPCRTCVLYNSPDYRTCSTCKSTEATEGIKPFYKKG